MHEALKTVGIASLLCLGAAVSSFAAPTYPPFALSDVGFTKDCNPNPAFVRLLSILSGPPRDYSDNTAPDIDIPVYNAVSGDTSQSLSLDTPADWNGLKLIGVSVNSGIERGPVNYAIQFADSAETVLATWNKLGWKFKAIDDARDVEGLEGYASIGVSKMGDGASVTCWRD